jgi:hypothetical protein
MYSIFIIVATTNGPVFTTVDQATALIEGLLKSFLTAFAIATGVCLFIIPVTSRRIVFREQEQYIEAFRGALRAQLAYMRNLENLGMVTALRGQNTSNGETNKRHNMTGTGKESNKVQMKEVKALKGAISRLTEFHSQLHRDMIFAKRETAYGKLVADDLNEIFKLLEAILLPVLGISTISDILERIVAERALFRSSHSTNLGGQSESQPPEEAEKRLWNEIIKAFNEQFTIISEAMDEGFQYILFALELTPRRTKVYGTAEHEEIRSHHDVEAQRGVQNAGDEGFPTYLKEKITNCHVDRSAKLIKLAKQIGVDFLQQIDQGSGPLPMNKGKSPNEACHLWAQQPLYLILFVSLPTPEDISKNVHVAQAYS